ncbi:MAG TPA: TadE/TadG family type IV pilus assembly protein [Herpetosiphonaceae bacterium]
MNIKRSWHIHRTLRKQVAHRFARRHASGQAMVELALAATFLALLFAAAVDLGIAYKSYQTLMNATAEASSYLTLYPHASCTSNSCDEAQLEAAADREARTRFRTEQGTQLKGSASTLDLDSNNVDDLGEHGWGWIEQRVRIQEADSSQIIITNDDFAVGESFNGTSNPDCLARKRFDSQGRQCYIVVRATIIYHPFAISPAVGEDMPIRAISVKPIVAGP